jgi:hypothetical protein
MKQIKFSLQTVIFLLFLGLWNFSCKKEITTEPQFPDKPEARSSTAPLDPGFVENDMVLYWNEKTYAVLNGPINPPSHVRYFAMIQIAVHDALNSIRPKYQRFALLNEREQFASPNAAVASASYWAIKGLNRQGNFPIDTWYNESLSSIPEGESKNLGIALGKKAAEAIIANRSNDNFAQANQILIAPDGNVPGEYRSTLPFSLPTMPKNKGLSQWGTLMKGFVVPNNDQFRPSAPYPVTSAEYVTDFDEVKEKGARLNHTRNAEEDEIGRFWVERAANGWNRFARNMIADKKLDAWKTARLFALLHTAMIDGITGCFESKYHYFYWRPETAIRLADDGNLFTTGEPDWLPSYTDIPNLSNPALNVYTPPIPEYPSAHSTFGGAASEILRLFFGTDIISVDQTSATAPGITRHYSTLSQAARDNSLSRIYVGYHFRNACLRGEEQGRQIANYVFNHSFKEN